MSRKRLDRRLIASIIIGGLSVSACASTPQETIQVETQEDYAALNQMRFDGGVEILFKRGQTFTGSFAPRRTAFDGTSGDIITIGAYGDADAHAPRLVDGGADTGTITIRDSGGWVIEDLQIENDAEDEQMRVGIYVLAEDSGLHNTIRIRNNIIRNVEGIHNNKDNGGIVVRVFGNAQETAYDDVLIEGNRISNISGVGMRLKSSWEGDTQKRFDGAEDTGRFAYQNVIVRGNIVHDTTRNAIIVGSSDSPLIEYNRVGPNISTEDTGNAIFNFATDNAVIQYNEAYGNQGDFSEIERGGIDADYNSINTVIQYNYTHDNHYAFAIMRRAHQGVTIRYNISENERFGFVSYGFPGESGLEDALIHNNTIYASNDDMALIVNNDGRDRAPISTTFVNNIFHYSGERGTIGYGLADGPGNSADTNVFIGLEGFGQNVLSLDPMLANAGSGGENIDFSDPSRLSGYLLCQGSPAIGAGKAVTGPLTDFWGTSINTSAPNIGAYEGDGVQCNSAD